MQPQQKNRTLRFCKKIEDWILESENGFYSVTLLTRSIQDLLDHGVKGTDESTFRVDSLVPLQQSDLELIWLEKKTRFRI